MDGKEDIQNPKNKTTNKFLMFRRISVTFIVAEIVILFLFVCCNSLTKLTNQPLPKHSVKWINSHPIYSKFNMPRATVRKRVTILIIVSTAPRRFDRRQAIRETWWQECSQTKQVNPECIFMTDHQEPNSRYYSLLQAESTTHHDMRFQHLDGGIQFGLRYLYHAVFALQNYEFDYFLRMDDDYFFCLHNFLQELPQPMAPLFHWGWVHCIISITRPEESIILLSRDLVLAFLSQDPNIIKCHPWADQMIAEWSNDLNFTKIFRHDNRIHHSPIVSEEPSLRSEQNICANYMSIHGCYPSDMRNFWTHRGSYLKTNATLEDNSDLCVSPKRFDWKLFEYEWKYEPKPCVTNPQWNTSKQSMTGGAYTGRQNV